MTTTIPDPSRTPTTPYSPPYLFDVSLSFRARGLLAFLVAEADSGCPIRSVAELAQCGREGISACRAAVVELERGGYLVRSGVRALSKWTITEDAS